MEGCIIHEVLISPLAASGMTYEVLISQFLPGRLDLRGFDLRKDNIYTIYIMYIRGFDLASDTQTGCYIRGFDLQHHKIRRLYARGFDLSAGVTQGADSRGLYLSPMRGTSKTRSKPRKWGDAGRGRRWTPNVIHFHKKATRYWESDWAVSTKNVDFCRKRGRKNGGVPHKRGWNSQKAMKSNNTLQSLPINRNSERSCRK